MSSRSEAYPDVGGGLRGTWRPLTPADAQTGPPAARLSGGRRLGARLPGFVALAIYLLVFGSLFNGLPGPAALGELRGEGTIPGELAVLAAAALTGVIADLRGLRSALVFAPFAACVVIGFALNADDIAAAHFLGREGVEKFLTSGLVIVFYFSLFVAVSCIASVYGVRAVLLCGSRAAFWCGVLVLAEMAVEVVTWFVPPLREAWREVRGLWVAEGSSAPMYRLVGFAPEPSLGAITAMGLLGLMACEAVIRGASGDWPRLRARAVLSVMAALFALELLLANARTFAISALGAGLAWLLASRIARPAPPAFRSAAIVLAPLPIQAVLVWAVLQTEPIQRSVSNITRSVGMITASQVWTQHPLLGVGLGQYGFHFRSVVPSWGAASFEVSRFFNDQQYDLLTGLPPSFSLFSRVAAELGFLGLAAWLLPPLIAIRWGFLRRPGPLTTVMICALTAQLWSGLSLDSYRNVFYWFWLAVLLAWPRQIERETHQPRAGGPA